MTLKGDKKREYQRKRRQEKIDRGECTRCSNKADGIFCEVCLPKVRKSKKKVYDASRASNLCNDCGKRVDWDRCQHEHSKRVGCSKGQKRSECLTCGGSFYTENPNVGKPSKCIRCMKRNFENRYPEPEKREVRLCQAKVKLMRRYLKTQSPALLPHFETEDFLRSMILLRL